MRYVFHILLILLLPISFAHGQVNLESAIRTGMQLHDKGDYKGAIEQYEKALEINPTSERVMYEMSFTYLAMEDYSNSLKYSTKVINSNHKPLFVDAYNVKSSALAGMNKYQEAIALLKDALKRCGEDYLLNYNLALTYFKNQDSVNAILYLEKSINEKVNYPESYFLYAYALSDQNRWIEATLVLNSFLLLSPDDERSKDVFDDMLDILQNKLMQPDEKIVMPQGLKLKKISDILMKVKNTISSSNKENSYLFFQEATKSILSELKLVQKDENIGMFWDYFVPTFIDILDSGYFDTFCRYISVSAYPESLSWWKDNKEKVNKFIEWFESTSGPSQMDEEEENIK